MYVCMYVFIYRLYSYRRIKLMFDQIKRNKGRHVFLEKICCRDYNEPVRAPDITEGSYINTTDVPRVEANLLC